MTNISSQTLHIVAKELTATLNEARAALEAYAERPDQAAFLEKCADQLHLAHGVLRLVEVYGAALLSEEMEHVTRYILLAGSDQKRQVEGLDALMRAMVQLPTYLERVLSGGRDLALVLLPLLNDLRSVRGSPLLSEGTLLLLNLKSDQPAQPQAQQGESAISIVQWARRLRPRFQIGLLGYIRGERTVQNLEVMAKIAEKLEQVATSQPVFQLWWVVGALLEALRANGLEGSATLKRLLGQCDRQIKALYELGEGRYCESPPIDLLNNLLYYVARASAGGGRIAAVRSSFKLAELLPVDDSVEQERESLSAPSVKLMRTVAAAIKEDLSKVKDVFDIFVRRGGGRSEELIPQLDLLKKISDTLGVLGLGELRQRVQQEVSDLSDIVTDGREPSEAALIKVAGVLLSVEDSLDDQLIRLILPAASFANELPPDQDHEFRQVSEAVLRECIVNLARIKEAVSVAVQKPSDFPPQGLDNVPQLLRGITAGLLMLGKGRAVELMDAIGTEVRKVIEPGAPTPDALRLERIADAIVSIEYYMETVQNGRNDPWYMLDNAEMCIKALLDQAPSRVPTVELPSGSDIAKTMRISQDATMAIAPPSTDHVATQPLMPEGAGPTVDPQFLELFIEEAKEEIATIQRSFPQWDQNPMDLDSLGILRRSFHTLKGSGRMVGARLIAEFGWSIENLLNRLIDKTLTRTPAMMVLLRNAVAALPQLVEQLETGRQNLVPVTDIMASAFAFADGREAKLATSTVVQDFGGSQGLRVLTPPGTGAAQPAVTPADPAAQSPDPATVPPASVPQADSAADSAAANDDAPEPPAVDLSVSAMDPLLHDIYSKETSSHVAEIRAYLRKRSEQPAPHLLPESTYRAIHTLSGSSKMAEARHGIRITEPLNHVMRKFYDSGQGLTDAGLTTLADAVRAIENVVAHINESTSFFVDQPSLVGRLLELEAELDAEIARAAAAADPGLSAIVPVPPPQVVEEFDHEIAKIYSEEATELLEAAEGSLAAWNSDRRNKERVADLQRQLHTLKGGARMAGITAMGDLSHELETLVINLDSGMVASDDHAHSVMQASLDELARMRDMVSAGSLPAAATSLLAKIRALTTGEVADRGPSAAPTQATPPAAPIAAPADAPLPAATEHGPFAAPAAATEYGPSDAPAAALHSPFDAPAAMEHTSSGAPAAATEDGPSDAPAAGTTLHSPPDAPAVAMTDHAPSDATAASIPPEAAPSAPIEAPPDAPAQSPAGAAIVVAEPVPSGAPTRLGDRAQTMSDESISNLEVSAAPVLPGRESAPAERTEMARVDAELLDTMLNNAGEVSIFRARLDQQVNSIDFNLAELARTVTRLKDQLRGLEIETEAQVLNRHHDDEPRRSDFDPLELDRYSALQQFSRALSETSGDVGSIQGLLETLTREAQNLLTQQARVITELQNSLMRTRMVPFQRHVQRLTRLVRQAANDTGKRAELAVQGASAELDRQMLERMLAPLEHMLRNAVVHGIEPAERRAAVGKPEVGRISVSLTRDGAEVVVVVTDDGSGINVKLIREKAVSLGLIDRHAKLTDEEAMQLILEPGFSTVGHVTQSAGRGVGMDVVATEVKKLGGGLFIESTAGKGSRFTIRLPFTLAISQALIVRVAEEVYALPLATVEGVVRLPRNIVARHLGKDAPLFEYGGQKYRFQQLASFVGLGATRLPESDVSMSVVLIRAGEHSTALVTDELVGSREIVVKSLGPQISGIRGIAGATILGDGRIVIILDMGSLVRSEWRAKAADMPVLDQRDRRTFALVVDDSITVRRVTQRLLERNGMRVLTAKDGVDAVSLLQDNLPDIILLDIEMPRMDGYEVAAHVRNDPRLKDIPIVMITSRVSEKHRARAIELGVDDYLGKPYQESQLLDAIEPLVTRRSAVAR
jgi:chemosensory pili system protein ChpA (sensor histidine kinase/response regulator)